MTIRPITADDIRSGMDTARRQYGKAPDKGLLTVVARMGLAEMLDSKSYRDAVKTALEEAGIEKSVRYLYWTALAPILGRYTNLIQIKEAVRPPVQERHPAPTPTSWKDRLLHYTSAARMRYERRDHLIPEHDR